MSSDEKDIDCTVIGDVFFDVLVYENPFSLKCVYGGTSYIDTIKMEPGGSGNIAVGLSRLGGNAQFIGKAGKDILGSFYNDDLIREGVKSIIFFDESHSTGKILSFVDKKGERSFLVSRGANNFLFPEEVELFKNSITRSKCLFVSGYSLLKNPQREAILKAVTIAKSSDVNVVFDPGAYNLVTQHILVFERLMNLCDVIALNFEEAKVLTNLDRIEDVVQYLSQRVPFIALKLGKDGCMIITPNKRLKCRGNKVMCVDSTGAGDAFVSALIYGLTRDLPLEATARLANWYASYNIQKLGARAFPTNYEIDNYFSTISTKVKMS